MKSILSSDRGKSALLALGYALVFFILIKPASVDFLGSSLLLGMYSKGFLVVGAIVLVLYIRFIRLDIPGVLILILCGTTLISTIVNDGDIGLWWRRWPLCAVAVMITSIGCRHGLKELLLGVFAATFLLSLANLLSMVLYPEGLYATSLTEQNANFFLGHRNNAYQVIIPSVGCGFLLGSIADRRWSFLGIVALLSGVFQLACAFSATTAVAVAVMGFCLILIQLRVFRAVCSLFTFIAGYAAFFCGVVVFRLQDFMAPFIEGVLHKNVSFTGRTFIWDKAMSLIGQEGPFLGNGMSAYRQLDVNGMSFAHAHNELLNLALVGGLPAAITLVGFVAYPAWRLFENRATKTAAIAALMAGIFLVVALTEVIDCPTFYFSLAIGCCMPFVGSAGFVDASSPKTRED